MIEIANLSILSILCIGFGIPSSTDLACFLKPLFQFFVLDSVDNVEIFYSLTNVCFQFFVLDSRGCYARVNKSNWSVLSILCIGFAGSLDIYIKNISDVNTFNSLYWIRYPFKDIAEYFEITFQFFVLDSERRWIYSSRVLPLHLSILCIGFSIALELAQLL